MKGVEERSLVAQLALDLGEDRDSVGWVWAYFKLN
jgi:hypothetical protein